MGFIGTGRVIGSWNVGTEEDVPPSPCAVTTAKIAINQLIRLPPSA